MEARELLSDARNLVLKRQTDSRKPNGEPFRLTSTYFWIREAGEKKEATFLEKEEAFSWVRCVAEEYSLPYAVLTPEELLWLLEKILDTP